MPNSHHSFVSITNLLSEKDQPHPKASTHAMGSTNPKDDGKKQRLLGHAGIIPMGISTVIMLAVTLSLFFILSICFAFMGSDGDEPHFKKTLNDVAKNHPGIVLLGESVDVDVDEPSISLRWSIIGCGDEYVLANSGGIHGSSCGLPAMPLRIFVDSNSGAKATYDPTQLPFVKNTGQRRNIQNLVQFDSDHVLDVHEARLYPFDTYFLTTTLRAVSPSNQSISIQKIASIDETSNFLVHGSDIDSYGTLADGTQAPSRDFDIRVTRPGQARAFALLLFGVSWMLTHVSIGHVALAWYTDDMKESLLKHLVFAFAILLAHPQLRNSMPDAPGYDGVLIDCIGFFPQMILSGISVIVLLIMLIKQEFDLTEPAPHNGYIPLPPAPNQYKGSGEVARPTRKPSSGRTSSIHIAHNDLSRLIRHLNGEFVYPPPNAAGSQVHRRNKSSRADPDSAYWTKKFDAPSRRSSMTIMHPVEEENPKFVIE